MTSTSPLKTNILPPVGSLDSFWMTWSQRSRPRRRDKGLWWVRELMKKKPRDLQKLQALYAAAWHDSIDQWITRIDYLIAAIRRSLVGAHVHQWKILPWVLEHRSLASFWSLLKISKFLASYWLLYMLLACVLCIHCTAMLWECYHAVQRS